MVGLAALVAAVVLGLAGEIARVGARVAVGGVLDQLLLRELEALGLPAPALADRALLLGVALLEVSGLKLVLSSIALLRLAVSAPPADSSVGGRDPAERRRQRVVSTVPTSGKPSACLVAAVRSYSRLPANGPRSTTGPSPCVPP